MIKTYLQTNVLYVFPLCSVLLLSTVTHSADTIRSLKIYINVQNVYFSNGCRGISFRITIFSASSSMDENYWHYIHTKFLAKQLAFQTLMGQHTHTCRVHGDYVAYILSSERKVI